MGDMSGGARLAALMSGTSVPPWVLNAAGARPTLDIKFDSDLAFVRGLGQPSIPSILSVTNANGTYIDANGLLTIPSSNTPRYGTAGLRCEEQRQNLWLNNRTLNNASGGVTETNATVTLNATTGIDAAASADRIEATAGGACSIARTFTGTAAAYCFQFLVNNDDCGWCALSLNNGTTTYLKNFDIASGALGANGANAPTNFGIEAIGSSGWYLVWIVATMAATTCTATLHITDADSASDPDAGEGLFADLPAVTAGLFPTSPIITAGSAVTRTIDNVSLTAAAQAAAGLSLAQGTWYVEWVDLAGPVSATARIISANVGSDFFRIARNSGNKLSSQINISTVNECALNSTNNIAANTPYKAAFAYKENDFAAAYPASLESNVLTDTSGNTLSGNTTWCIGSAGTSESANSLIKRIAWFPQRLSNSVLDGLRAA